MPKKILFCFFLLFSMFICGCMKQSTVEKKVKKIDQNPLHYLNADQKTFDVTPQQQAQLKQSFLTLYFFPWDGDQTKTNEITLQKVQKDQTYYLKSPGFTFNHHSYSQADIQKLIENSNLDGYPAINQPGVVVNFADVRIFPTLLPSYNDPALAGEGYPFDNWIASLIAPGTPVRILQQSKDKIWYLIKTSSYYGWVFTHDVAFVNDAFMQEWKKHPFLVARQDNVPLQTNTGLTISSMRKGVIYPSPEQSQDKNQVLIPTIDPDGYAKTMAVFADPALTALFPLNPTAEHIADFANTFIGSPYGWGGLYRLRDCSSTQSDLFAGFGFWLPRNSLEQAQVGEKIDLTGKSSAEKIRIIHNQGAPFFTIVHFPGHVALYVGEKKGIPYLFQEMWGLHTQSVFGMAGRAVVGYTAITPANMGKNYINIKDTQIDHADALIILNPESYANPLDILNKVWTVQPSPK